MFLSPCSFNYTHKKVTSSSQDDGKKKNPPPLHPAVSSSNRLSFYNIGPLMSDNQCENHPSSRQRQIQLSCVHTVNSKCTMQLNGFVCRGGFCQGAWIDAKFYKVFAYITQLTVCSAL